MNRNYNTPSMFFTVAEQNNVLVPNRVYITKSLRLCIVLT